MDFNFDLIIESFPLLLMGAGVTIKITTLSVLLGVIIGLVVGILRICTLKPLRILAMVYIDFLRGTPLLVQIFLVPQMKGWQHWRSVFRGNRTLWCQQRCLCR